MTALAHPQPATVERDVAHDTDVGHRVRLRSGAPLRILGAAMKGNGRSLASTDLVRYSDDIETFDPKLDEYTKRIVA